MRFSTFLCIIAALLSRAAVASTGDPCYMDAAYASGGVAGVDANPNEVCYQICDDIATGVSNCTPSARLSFAGTFACVWSIGKHTGTCDASVIPLQEGEASGGDFTTLATLTGPTAPSASEYIMLRRPLPWTKTSGMTIASGCSALDILLTCQKR